VIFVTYAACRRCTNPAWYLGEGSLGEVLMRLQGGRLRRAACAVCFLVGFDLAATLALNVGVPALAREDASIALSLDAISLRERSS
jgi:hypothetical protein